MNITSPEEFRKARRTFKNLMATAAMADRTEDMKAEQFAAREWFQRTAGWKALMLLTEPKQDLLTKFRNNMETLKRRIQATNEVRALCRDVESCSSTEEATALYSRWCELYTKWHPIYQSQPFIVTKMVNQFGVKTWL